MYIISRDRERGGYEERGRENGEQREITEKMSALLTVNTYPRICS
jgi:hypothetical protein